MAHCLASTSTTLPLTRSNLSLSINGRAFSFLHAMQLDSIGSGVYSGQGFALASKFSPHKISSLTTIVVNGKTVVQGMAQGNAVSAFVYNAAVANAHSKRNVNTSFVQAAMKLHGL